MWPRYFQPIGGGGGGARDTDPRNFFDVTSLLTEGHNKKKWNQNWKNVFCF